MLENFSALFLLFILLPVIILYILRTKPKTIKIPSLMLLLPAVEKSRLKSLFEKLIRDPILLIQLITITLLVIALANPYYPSNVRHDQIVVVLDSSASMFATDVAPDRFAQAVNIAKEYIRNSEKVSVVLSANIPVLLFKDADNKKALSAVGQLKPKATGTNLNEAMLFALDLIGNLSLVL